MHLQPTEKMPLMYNIMEPLAPEIGQLDRLSSRFVYRSGSSHCQALVCLVPKKWNLKILVFLDLFEILQCFTFKKCYLLLVNSHLGKFLEMVQPFFCRSIETASHAGHCRGNWSEDKLFLTGSILCILLEMSFVLGGYIYIYVYGCIFAFFPK